MGTNQTRMTVTLDSLWKMRALFDLPSDNSAKLYILSEQLAVDEVIVLFKGMFFSNNIFQRNISALV
jgi:hypothetical protein